MHTAPYARQQAATWRAVASQAAEKLGMSYPALKHWILAGRIKTVKTPGGHHRIPVEALEEFLPSVQAHAGPGRISGRAAS